VEVFPGLAKGNYQITSPANPDYNCMAWAVGEICKWWWSGPDEKREYWPPGILRETTQSAFEAAFALFGYERCTGEDAEPGFEKIALFADTSGKPMHVARQLTTGRWTSKLGRMEDIETRAPRLGGRGLWFCCPYLETTCDSDCVNDLALMPNTYATSKPNRQTA
jgi:hypothetical protein